MTDDEQLAAQLRGHLYTAYCVGDEINPAPIREGHYTSATVQKRKIELTSEVACPYCREPMREAIGAGARRVARVVKRLSDERAIVIGQDVPKTHRVFGCQTCRAIFTQPKAKKAG